MDISFDCGKCGKHLVIDEAAAGITIDCPQCGKPVFAPSNATPRPSDPPTRVEVKATGSTTNTIPVAHNNPLIPSYSSQKKSDVHPSIEAGIHCLLILVIIQFIGLVLVHQGSLWALGFMVASVFFTVTPLLCAVYGMCIGHVKHGLLIVAGLAVITGFSYRVMLSPMVQPSADTMRRQMEEMQRLMGRP